MNLIIVLVTFGVLLETSVSAFKGDIYGHDPSFIKSGPCYYIFDTRQGRHKLCNDTSVKTGHLLETIPKWIKNFTKVNPSIWAPDINYFNGQFYMYYVGSSMGSRNSVIALATSTKVDGPYVDRGEVIHTSDALNYNAIDPEIAWTIVNGKRTEMWLVFGSYWSGIKARRLNMTTGHLSIEDTKLYSLASRGGKAIEASSVAYRNGYYYLFVSFDACCRGANSTYRIMVGRSHHITGPYVDKNGVDMMKGGGTQLMASHGNVRGPGGQDVYLDGGIHRMIYHWYDANDGGKAKYEIVDILWSADGWPSLGSESKLNYH